MSRHPAIFQGVPVSPCIKLCALDAHGYCVGCYRTMEEIVRWSSMSVDEQWAVLHRVAGAQPSGRER